MKYKVYNMLDAWEENEVDVILQGCNCFCAFGRGLALEIKERYPKAYAADQRTEAGNKNKLGTFSFIEPKKGKFLVNCYTQYHWIKGLNNEKKIIKNGKSVFVLANNEAIRQVMINLRTKFNTNFRFGIPKIGAGLANGNWVEIEAIIKEELIDKGYDVVFYVIDEKEIPEGREII